MEHLRSKLSELPDKPGVYHYFDTNGKLLYIGKAKSLKNRVKSYFRFLPEISPANNLSSRIYSLISQTKDVSWIVVSSEHDALILENSLIKQLKPKYNILLRDDKTYPYIYIDLSLDFPRFEVTRKVVKEKNVKYFGPYSMSASVLIESLYEKYPLVQKKSCIKGKKACLFYQIKRCLAPCEGKITPETYKEIINNAIDFLSSKNKISKYLYERMLFHSEKLEFEKAAVYKQKFEKIEKSMILSDVDIARFESFDVISIANEHDKASIVRLFIRGGKLTSSSSHITKSSQEIDSDELYKRAILDFYHEHTPLISNKIYVADSFEDITLVAQTLSKRYEKKISILHPQRGEKNAICKLAHKNALEILRLEKKDDHELLLKIQSLCELSCIPYVIEVFDNSHIQGEATVASMITYKEGHFDKSHYKHYNLEAKDEYGQMRELLIRRVQSFEKNPPPDLWVIDGGVGQLNIAQEILQSCGTNLDVIAISKEKIDAKAHRAKGGAKDIIHTISQTIRLEKSDKRLHFIQKLRDEAHRFAIEFHRKQKTHKDKMISLLQTRGIGEAKVKRLLDYFGTFEKIQTASLEELSLVIDTKTAHNLKEYYAKHHNT